MVAGLAGFAVALSVGTIGIATLRIGTARPARVAGKPLSRDEAPALWQTVDALAAQLDVRAPDSIVVGLDPTVFVTSVPVQAGAAPCEGRTMFLSLPFARVLDDRELSAVIAHELGHFKGGDLEVSERFYPIYRRSVDALGVL